KNVAVRLGVIPVTGGETVWVEWDRKKYEYLAAVRWDPLGPLTVQLQDRRQQQLALVRVDPATGATRPLLEETDPAWVAIRPHLPAWVKNFGKDPHFVWV